MSRPNSVRLFMTVDKLMYREALLFQLLNLPEIDFVGESSGGAETLQALDAAQPDLLIIEENLEDNDGLTISEIALSKMPSLVIILLVESDISQQRLSIYLEAGIKSVIPLSHPVQQLIKAIEYVGKGQFYVDSTNFSSTQSSKPLDVDAFYALSVREQEVAKMMADRLAIKTIAEQLGLSHKTIHTYKERILVKMGFEKVPELLLFMHRLQHQSNALSGL